MKKKYCYGMLLAGLLFAVAGCGDQKQSAAPKTREQTKSKLKPKAGLTLEEALKQKFDVSPGWDAGKKCFIAITEIAADPKNQSNYSITLFHNGQIIRPDFRTELQGAILALEKLADFIEKTAIDKNGMITTHSSVTFGQLKVEAKRTYEEKTRESVGAIEVSRGKEQLFLLNDAYGKISFRYNLAAPDINLFKHLLASNGLEYTLIGWSEEDGVIRMAISLGQLSTWKGKMATASKAQLEYTKKEVRSQVKTGMKKLSRKLDEWSEEETR